MHPNEFEGIAREAAFADQDYCDDPNDEREVVQTTILSRSV